MCYQHLNSLIFYFNDLFYFRPFISHAVCNSSSSKPSRVDGAIRFFKLSARRSNLYRGRNQGKTNKKLPCYLSKLVTPPSSSRVCTSPRALRVCALPQHLKLWDKQTPKSSASDLDFARAQDQGHVSSDTAHLFLWSTTQGFTHCHYRALCSTTPRTLQQSAGTRNTATFSH